MNLLTELDISNIEYELKQRIQYYEEKKPFGEHIYPAKIKRIQSIIDKLHGANHIKIYHPEPESTESRNPIDLLNYLNNEKKED